MNEQKRPVIVMGHKNPDTDSICAAITYANLKRKITGDKSYNLTNKSSYSLFCCDRKQVSINFWVSYLIMKK